MADQEIPLPVGFRFHPTDQEIVGHYLLHKLLADDPSINDTIPEIGVCKWEPWDLLDRAASAALATKFDEFQCFFFSPCDYKYSNSTRFNRTTLRGFWKVTGRDRRIKQRGTNNVIGTKKTLVFHERCGDRGLKTNWVIHEYHDQMLPRGQRSHVLCWLKKNNEKETKEKLDEPSFSNRSSMVETAPQPRGAIDSMIQRPLQPSGCGAIDSMIQTPPLLSGVIDSMIQTPPQPSGCGAIDSLIQTSPQPSGCGAIDSMIETPPQPSGCGAIDSMIETPPQPSGCGGCGAIDSMIETPPQPSGCGAIDSMIETPPQPSGCVVIDSMIQTPPLLNQAIDSMVHTPPQLNETIDSMVSFLQSIAVTTPFEPDEAIMSKPKSTSETICDSSEFEFNMFDAGGLEFSLFDAGEFDFSSLLQLSPSMNEPGLYESLPTSDRDWHEV